MRPSDEASRAHWRQFFGWPPPLDVVRFSEILSPVYRGEIASAVTGNPFVRYLHG